MQYQRGIAQANKGLIIQEKESNMSNLSEILEFNMQFVAEKQYEKYQTNMYPEKKMVILTCMDTRLLELLPQAMNLKNGDVKIIRNAGAVISQPFGGIMRSIMVAIYELQAEEVWVIGHSGCGMARLDSEKVLEKMKKRGISQEVLDTILHSGINLKKWLSGFDCVEESVKNSVALIRRHPLLPKGLSVHGLIIDPHTGKLDLLENGYEAIKQDTSI